MKRKAPLARGGRIRPKKRKASEYSRIYGSKARVAWVKSLPCLVCGYGPSENAHVVGGGMGRKASHTAIVPLCADHHRQSHQLGWSSLGNRWGDARYRIERSVHIAKLWDEYAEGK